MKVLAIPAYILEMPWFWAAVWTFFGADFYMDEKQKQKKKRTIVLRGMKCVCLQEQQTQAVFESKPAESKAEVSYS